MPAPDSSLFLLLAVMLSYLLGSIPFAVVVSRFMGLADPRSYGSGNPGATNVLRSGNKAAAALTLLGDAFKGWLAIWCAMRTGLDATGLAWVALAVFLGHLYPVFLSFKGGKGVATALGVVAAIAPLLALALVVIWIAVVLLSRFSSLAAIFAAILAPVLYLLGGRYSLWPTHDQLALVVAVVGALLLYRHKTNIERLLKGLEPKVGKKS